MFMGTVQQGTGEAGRLGFPTANIPFEDRRLSGIFAARVLANDTSYPAAAYVDQKRHVLEAHLINFTGRLSGERIVIDLQKKIRDSEAFKDRESLRAAIANDVHKVQRYFGL